MVDWVGEELLPMGLYVAAVVLLIGWAAVRQRRIRPAEDIEAEEARALGLEAEQGIFAGSLGGHRALLFRSDGVVVLRLMLPGVRWMFDAEAGAGRGEDPWEGMAVAWGQTPARHLAATVRRRVHELRAFGRVRARDGYLELRLEAAPDVRAAEALVAVAAAAVAAPTALQVAADPSEPMDLRTRCYRQGLGAASPEELARLLDVDVLAWRFEAACQLRDAARLLTFLRRGLLDEAERSRAVLRLPMPLPTAHAAEGVRALVRAVSMGLMTNALDAAVWLLVHHTTAQHVDTLRALRAHVEGAADQRLAAHLRTLLEQEGLGGGGGVSLVGGERGQGALSVVASSAEGERPREVGRPGRVPEG